MLMSWIITFFFASVVSLSTVQNNDPYFPVFHVRPPAGHVNDPNGPFYDPIHKKYHLFMQWHSYHPPKTTPGIEWAHFSSSDLVKWKLLPVGIPSDGVGCPNTNGCYSGSTVVVNGKPTIVYPGVHSVPKSPTHPDGVGMAQCLARPKNMSDPDLREWISQIIVPTDPVPGDVNNHYHDDSEPWKSASDNRWYMFASGGSMNRSRGVNILYSTTENEFMTTGGGWRMEHALWNITTGQCNFVSCPEMYSLPGAPGGTPRTSGPVVYESLCGCDQYWLGHYDDKAHTFTPNAPYVPPGVSGKYCYDYGHGRASKSFWHEKSKRRIMWSWLTGGRHPANATWDGCQTVPREITLPSTTVIGDRAPELHINPIAEVAQLRVSPPIVNIKKVPLSPTKKQPIHTVGNQLDVLLNVSWSHIFRSTSAGVRVLMDEKDSGTMVYFTAVQSSAQFMPDTNLPRGDVSKDDFLLNHSIPWTDETGSAECVKFCNAHSECTGWTYVRPGANNGPRCAIKGVNQTDPPRKASCCVSGYKPGHGVKVPNITKATVCVNKDLCMDGHIITQQTTNTMQMQLRILVDHSVIEVYDSVAALITHAFADNPQNATDLQLVGLSGEMISSITVYQMTSAILGEEGGL